MDVNGSARFRHRKIPSSDRLLGVYPRATDQSTHTSTADFSEENELNEDDIFSAGDFSESSNYQNQQHYHTSTSSSSASSSPRHHNSHVNKAFSQAESFGILAALPENKISSHLHLYQKTAISSPSSPTSSSSTTSSRFIPFVSKPPQERLPNSMSFSSSKFHHPQSAPVDVPMLAMAMRRRRQKEFDEIDEDANEEEEDEDEMLPPHEMVARTQSPLLACSVLEGVGRTLKGRDLRQVRNAVWRRTGFLD